MKLTNSNKTGLLDKLEKVLEVCTLEKMHEACPWKKYAGDEIDFFIKIRFNTLPESLFLKMINDVKEVAFVKIFSHALERDYWVTIYLVGEDSDGDPLFYIGGEPNEDAQMPQELRDDSQWSEFPTFLTDFWEVHGVWGSSLEYGLDNLMLEPISYLATISSVGDVPHTTRLELHNDNKLHFMDGDDGEFFLLYDDENIDESRIEYIDEDEKSFVFNNFEEYITGERSAFIEDILNNIDENSYESLRDSAYALSESGVDDKVLSLYKKAFTLNPDFDRGDLAEYPTLLDDEDDYEEVKKYYENRLKRYPEDAEFLFDYIDLIEDNEDDDLVESLYKTLLEVEDDELMLATIHKKYGRFLEFNKKEYELAHKYYLSSINYNDTDARAHYRYARLLHYKLKRDFDIARKHYKKAVKLDEYEEDYTHAYASLLQFEFDENDKAEKYYQMSLDYMGEDDETDFDRAKYFCFFLSFYQEKPKKAKKWYKKLFKTFKDNFSDFDSEEVGEVHAEYADLLAEEFNDLEKADKFYKKALKYNKSAFNYYQYASFNEEHKKDLQKAKELYEESLDLDYEEDTLSAYISLLQDLEEDSLIIKKLFKKLISISDEKEHYHEYLNFLVLHRYIKESKSLNSVMYKKFPDDIRVRLNYAILLCDEEGKQEEAINIAESLLAENSEDLTIISGVGLIYHKLKDYDKTRTLYEKALTKQAYMPNMLSYYISYAQDTDSVDECELFLESLIQEDDLHFLQSYMQILLYNWDKKEKAKIIFEKYRKSFEQIEDAVKYIEKELSNDT